MKYCGIRTPHLNEDIKEYIGHLIYTFLTIFTITMCGRVLCETMDNNYAINFLPHHHYRKFSFYDPHSSTLAIYLCFVPVLLKLFAKVI